MTTSIVFMGTPQFAVPILQSLIDHPEYDVQAVLTQPDHRVGRKHVLTASPVKRLAVGNDIKVLQPAKLSKSPEMQEIIDLHPDLLITAAYGQFLPSKLLAAAKIAAINVHGSLLPKNPAISDFLIKQAAIKKYGEFTPVVIDDTLVEQARASASARPR